jgi:hypothetical protein
MFLIRRCNFLGHPVQIWILPFTRKKLRKTLNATFYDFFEVYLQVCIGTNKQNETYLLLAS